MRQQNGLHLGYELATTHQARLRTERSHDRVVGQAMRAARSGRGPRVRARGLLYSKMAATLVICIPLFHTLSASHVAARHTAGHIATVTHVVTARAGNEVMSSPHYYPISR